ncbi:BAG family molecular chaperone regulator 4 [Ambystoma mexicanum]|uniref:BAG family molecular chaperone regulator 4 n=1 Tax=Ambystoma mexicanum TaxID=8296 RepID=UPI0037E9266D
MSALRRPGVGGGEAGPGYGYYGVEQLGTRAQSGVQESALHWGQTLPAYYQQHLQDMGNGWGEPARSRGQQEQPYPGYNPGYWNAPAPTRPSYPSTYPVGPEMQGQGMESYTNGVYGSPYTPTPPGVVNQPYPNIHPSNPFYSSGHPQGLYSTEPSSMYKSTGSVPASNAQWSYPPQQSCQDCASHRGQIPGYPAFSAHHQAPGLSAAPYPYGAANHGIPQQAAPQSRPQDETWGHQRAYGMPQAQQQYWPQASTASHVAPGNPFIAGSTSSWSSSTVNPTSYDPKENCHFRGRGVEMQKNGVTRDAQRKEGDNGEYRECEKDPSYPSSYSKQDQGTDHSGYYPEPETYNVRTIQDDKPSPVNPKSHFSASPQLYDNGPVKELANQDDGSNSVHSNSSDNLDCHPAIQKIVHVLEKVHFLDNEVEEFVGKKTDKAYKCLEELLTKELLELDSVETMGLDSIRQVRKEAVRKLQTILEKLERKGL